MTGAIGIWVTGPDGDPGWFMKHGRPWRGEEVMAMANDETRALLEKAGEERPGDMVRDLCTSMASFIAEIDASSADVAAYLEQRLGPVLRAAYHNGGLVEFQRAVADGRRLAKR